ncbi:hypothetical protein [Streptomyces tsukubensis]|uniref:hypothetical protein n=1 Tax=Streptomyces tsukubensis TaxID=83656 RepID=UPI00344C2768
MLFIARHEPHWPARHAEVEITDYSGIGRWYDHQDVWYVKNDRTPPGRYEARRLIDADDGWCVVATPSEAVAGIHFGRRGQATTTESEARAWAEALNLKFPTA